MRLGDIDTSKRIEITDVHNGATALRFVKQEVPNLVMFTWFGAHLYGTHTAESDLDFKGIFLIPEKKLILGEKVKSYKFSTKSAGSGEKNQSNDVDIEIYSLHYFLELLAKGETVALDMLHSPLGYAYGIIFSSQLWRWIREHRKQFYTSEMKAFVGYARKQAAKYGVKGSRIADLRNAISVLLGTDHGDKMYTVWDYLYVGEHARKIQDPQTGVRFYEILGRRFQDSVIIGYVLDRLQGYLDEYGKRALLAEKNEGVDWKAMSHALRAAYSLYDIFQFGKMTLPRFEASYLLAVKKGLMNFKAVSQELESMLTLLDKLSQRVEYPKRVKKELLDTIILMAYGWPTSGGLLL